MNMVLEGVLDSILEKRVRIVYSKPEYKIGYEFARTSLPKTSFNLSLGFALDSTYDPRRGYYYERGTTS